MRGDFCDLAGQLRNVAVQRVNCRFARLQIIELQLCEIKSNLTMSPLQGFPSPPPLTVALVGLPPPKMTSYPMTRRKEKGRGNSNRHIGHGN